MSRPAAPAAPRLRVLVVDDDNRVVTALRATLALEADLLVVGDAGDAETALRVARSTRPDVVLLDILLPDETVGLALVTTLGAPPGCAVVAMSIRSSLRAAALDAGAVAFVAKADGVDAVLSSVRAAGHRIG
jgi:DNA-binding NarL/FixJ family response regulator